MLLVLDGLGWDQLRERWALAPNMASMDAEVLTSVAPSTTSTALTSITTGLPPGEHGIVGYRVDLGGTVANMLRWHDGTRDLRRVFEPERVQPFPPFLGARVSVVTKSEFAETGFTRAHLRGTAARSWRMSSAISVEVSEALAAGDELVYAYYDGIDKVAHEFGFGPRYDAELRAADRIVGDLLDAAPSDVCVLVTADHGQVEVREAARSLPEPVMRHVHHQSGEGRFRWLHAHPGQHGSLLAAATAAFSHVAWVVTKAQVLERNWLGPVVSGPIASRLGDVALVPFADVAFSDPDDTGGFPLICRHGSLTAAEMLVPFLGAHGRSVGR